MKKTGMLSINGVNDEQLRIVLGIKIRNESHLVFNPQQLQPLPKQPQQEQFYNNMVLSWTDDAGAKAVGEILHSIIVNA